MIPKAQTAALLVGLLAAAATSARTPSGDEYLTPHLKVAESYGDVFSISHSVRADGYDEYVRRNGGSADYVVAVASRDSWTFHGGYRYDGTPGGENGELRDGGRTICTDGKCERYTDGTGLLYNPALWGSPPDHLVAGMTWTVQIDEPWELGAAHGIETVTVVHVDPTSTTAILMREGVSRGFFDGEPTQLKMIRQGQTVVLNVVPGVAHWKGYATFAKGVVVSDELAVTRTDVLRAADGAEVNASARWIMLLNAAPAPVEARQK